MQRAIRTRATWLAVGLVIGGASYSVAAVGVDTSGVGSPPEVALENKAEAKEHAADAKSRGARAHGRGFTTEGRKQNHGFYVSRAAHCLDVPRFNPPADCASSAEAHDRYVSRVAESDLGKPEHAGTDDTGDAEE